MATTVKITDNLFEAITEAEETGFSGIILGPVAHAGVTDEARVRQVFEYKDGECIDHYVTSVGGEQS